MGDKQAAGALRRRATYAAGISLQPIYERSAAGFHGSSDTGPEKTRETRQPDSKRERKTRGADTSASDTLR